MSTRLQAFTVMELVVAMAIASVVLMLSYSGYSLVTKIQYKVQLSRQVQFNRESSIAQVYVDFYNAESIELVNGQLVFFDQNKQVVYTPIDAGFVRQQLYRQDTLPIYAMNYSNEQLKVQFSELAEDFLILHHQASAVQKIRPLED